LVDISYGLFNVITLLIQPKKKIQVLVYKFNFKTRQEVPLGIQFSKGVGAYNKKRRRC